MIRGVQVAVPTYPERLFRSR